MRNYTVMQNLKNFPRKQKMKTLPIIHEDDFLVIVEKPAGMLSVPGKQNRGKVVTSLTRSQEWATVLESLRSCEVEQQSACQSMLEALCEQNIRVPRQREKFLRYTQRLCKGYTTNDILRIWQIAADKDREMFGTLPAQFPEDLISAADIIEEYLKQRVFHLHRLDQETSGILMFAKDSITANIVSAQFRDHQIQKVYIALVHGDLVTNLGSSGKINFPLAAEEGRAPRQKVDYDKGKTSETEFRAITQEDARYTFLRSYFPGFPSTVPTTLVELFPLTGRTHQLRVHLAASGFPIVGDQLYSAPEQLDIVHHCRLCLHALAITFTHPSSSEIVTISTIVDKSEEIIK